MDADEITWTTANARVSFSHIPQQRKEEAIRRRKQKKREWMAKLYKLGKEGLEPGTEKEVGFDLPQGGQDAGEDDEDELLRWTEQLDFEDYMDTWRGLATSNSTLAYIPQNDADYMDPEEVRIVADSATLFAQNYISSEPFKGGLGVNTLNFRVSDLQT